MKNIFLTVGVLLILVVIHTSSCSNIDPVERENNYSAGMREYEAKRFSESVSYLERAASLGDTRAQEMLGYRNGQRPDTSRILLKMRLAIKSADSGILSHTELRQLIDEMLNDIHLSPFDKKEINYFAGMREYEAKRFSESVSYLERAASLGDTRAQEMLGYRNGQRPDTSRVSLKMRLAIKSADSGILSHTELRQLIDEMLKGVPLSPFDKKEIENYRDDVGTIVYSKVGNGFTIPIASHLARSSVIQANDGLVSIIMKIGVRYYRQARFSIAAPMLEIAADCGDTEAQRILGYRNGRKPDTSRISFKMRLAIKKAYDDD